MDPHLARTRAIQPPACGGVKDDGRDQTGRNKRQFRLKEFDVGISFRPDGKQHHARQNGQGSTRHRHRDQDPCKVRQVMPGPGAQQTEIQWNDCADEKCDPKDVRSVRRCITPPRQSERLRNLSVLNRC